MTVKDPIYRKKGRRRGRQKARIGFRIATFSVRGVVRLFGSGSLGLLLVPFTCYHYFRRKEDRLKFEKMRGVLPPEFWGSLGLKRHYYRMLYTWFASLSVSILYDLLGNRKLAKRFRFIGKRPEEYPGDKPLIVAFLHAGGFSIIRVLQRSHRVPTASYGSIPKIIFSLKKVFQRGDQRYGLTGIPHHLVPGETRELVEFVRPGRMLYIAVDGRFDQWSRPIECDGVILHLNDGAVKLAMKSGATLMPAWVDRKGAFNFNVTYGDPVPEAMLQRRGDTAGALEYLAHQFWQHAKESPETITWTTLEAIAPEKKVKRKDWP